MKYISLTNSSLTYFVAKGELSQLSGSSKYNVFDNVIVSRVKQTIGKIENKTALVDYLQYLITDNKAVGVELRIILNYCSLWTECKAIKFTSQIMLDRLEVLQAIVERILKSSPEFATKYSLLVKNIEEHNSRYQTRPRKKLEYKQLNKSKVKGKMYALFNLKCSSKFIAFYSVSFPDSTSDEEAFICWNYWLTQLRKRFDLTNYIWVTERQKNGTIHYHMLTNNYMPILQINRLMAIIINNRVNLGSMSWGASSLTKYNGVDVDSIFNSKRHNKTGKQLNPSEIRNWIAKYVTKYVTKNSDKFRHLCWHCSRSISILFTSTVLLVQESRLVTDYLPKLRHLYENFKGQFNDTWVFHFVPPEHLYSKIRLYNDLIFGEFVPGTLKIKNSINYKTLSL